MKKSEVQSKLIGNDKYKYSVEFTNIFKKDVVNAAKRNLDLKLLGNAIKILATKGKLPPEYKAHKLEGNFSGYWECHIKGDWLMVCEITAQNNHISKTDKRR